MVSVAAFLRWNPACYEEFQSMAKRRSYSTDFKAKVALAVILGGGSMAVLASRNGIYPNMIAKWKRPTHSGMKEGFGSNAHSAVASREAEIQTLQANVG